MIFWIVGLASVSDASSVQLSKTLKIYHHHNFHHRHCHCDHHYIVLVILCCFCIWCFICRKHYNLLSSNYKNKKNSENDCPLILDHITFLLYIVFAFVYIFVIIFLNYGDFGLEYLVRLYLMLATNWTTLPRGTSSGHITNQLPEFGIFAIFKIRRRILESFYFYSILKVKYCQVEKFGRTNKLAKSSHFV